MGKEKLRKAWKIGRILAIVAGILAIVWVCTSIRHESKDKYCCNSWVGSICVDKKSNYYGCNTKDEMCSENYLKIASAISILEASGVKIYGRTGCGWCARQLGEFGSEAEYLKSNGIYVDCETSSDEMCKNIHATPSWAISGQVVHEGYVPIDQIK